MRAWRPLVAYELLVSLVFAVVLGPLVATCTYHIIGLSGEAVLGNFELLSFLASPLGVLALVLFAGVGFALVLLEFAGLILLTDAALCRARVPARALMATLVHAAPRCSAWRFCYRRWQFWWRCRMSDWVHSRIGSYSAMPIFTTSWPNGRRGSGAACRSPACWDWGTR